MYIDMDVIDQIKQVRETNKKYTVAAFGILIAFLQTKGESAQLDALLLGIASTYLDRANQFENKLDQNKYNELLQSIKTGTFDGSSLTELMENDDLAYMLKYLNPNN